MTDVQIGTYRHYKGKPYRVIGVAKHTETLEKLVVYEALYDDHQLWIRSESMFLEGVEIDGKKIPRFTFTGQKKKQSHATRAAY